MEYHRFNTSSGSSSDSIHHLQPSLSSQRSLASVPSLNSHSHRYASTTTHNCLTTLTPSQTSYTSSLTISENFLYIASSDREIRSWNRTNQHSTNYNNMVVAGKGVVKSLIVHSNNLFSAHQDHKIRVWKIQNQQKFTPLATLPTFSDRVSKGLNPKNHVKIRRHKKCTWVHHVDTVSALALSKDVTLLYSVSWDRTIKIWRTKDFICLESISNAHDDAINAVAVSDDGTVYTGSADKRIKVWKKGESEKKHSLVDMLEKHNSGINALALSRDCTLLYSGACDRSILVWEKGKYGKMVVVGAIRGHTKSILCLAVALEFICSGSEDKTIRIWRDGGVDHKEYSCLAVLEGHRGPIKSLTAVVEEHHCDQTEATFIVYSGSLDCDIKVWQIFVPVL